MNFMRLEAFINREMLRSDFPDMAAERADDRAVRPLANEVASDAEPRRGSNGYGLIRGYRGNATRQYCLVNNIPEPLPPHPSVAAVPRPVDEKRLSLDVVQIDVTPEAAVVAFVAVVAHDEDVIFRHGLRAVIVLDLNA